MKPRYWLLLAVSAALSLQVAACSSEFSSCAASRTCAPSGGEAGDGGDSGLPSGAGTGGHSGASGKGGAPDQIEAGASGESGTSDQIDGGAAGEPDGSHAGRGGSAGSSGGAGGVGGNTAGCSPGTIQPCGECGTRTCSASGAFSECTPAEPSCADGTHSEVCSATASPVWVKTACSAGSACSGGACLKSDGQPCALSGDCLTGQCTLFYRDSDGDGFGTGSDNVKVCGQTPPAGYVTSNSDCCDTDVLAKPTQLDFFTLADKCGSFDYDCANGAELELPIASKCTGNAACVKGWTGDTAPACGTAATAIGFHANAGAVYPSTPANCH